MGTPDERTSTDGASVMPTEGVIDKDSLGLGESPEAVKRHAGERLIRVPGSSDGVTVVQADEVKVSTHEDEIRKQRVANLKKAREKRAANLKAAKERMVSAVSEPVKEPVVRECTAKRRGSTMMHPMWVLVFNGKREWSSDMTLTRRPEDGVAIGQGIARLVGIEHGDQVKVTIEKVKK